MKNLKCSNCGSTLVFNDNESTTKCLHCGSKFTMRNDTSKTIIKNITNINTDNITIPISNIENLLNLANDCLHTKDYSKAQNLYDDILKINNSHIEALVGRVICYIFIDDCLGKGIMQNFIVYLNKILENNDEDFLENFYISLNKKINEIFRLFNDEQLQYITNNATHAYNYLVYIFNEIKILNIINDKFIKILNTTKTEETLKINLNSSRFICELCIKSYDSFLFTIKENDFDKGKNVCISLNKEQKSQIKIWFDKHNQNFEDLKLDDSKQKEFEKNETIKAVLIIIAILFPIILFAIIGSI